MAHLYDKITPSLIDEEMLLTAVEEQGPKDEAGEIAKAEGIDFHQVKSLRLDYRNIMTMQGLFQFTGLTKLQLDNNIIEKIQGIDTLVNLVWLDLSFNSIQVIEGMDKLTKIEDLTFYNNKISRIQNMDNLKNLEVFSIGNNELNAIDNLVYLRRFPKLKTLNLSNNPICEMDVYSLYTAAILPNLVYLDYQLMEDTMRDKGYQKYVLPVEQLLDKERRQAAEEELAKTKAEQFALHTAAFVENLNGPHLFDAMYKNDREGTALNTMPNAGKQAVLFRETFVDICHKAFDFGVTAYHQRKAEVDLFWECVELAKTEDRKAGMKVIEDFIAVRSQTLEQLRDMRNTGQVKRTVSVYHARITMLWDKLMGNEMHLAGEIEEAIENLDYGLQDHVGHFLENIQGFMTKLRDAENNNHETIMAIANGNLEPILRGDVEVSDKLVEIFTDKDSMVGAVAASHDTHMLVIDSREDKMVSGINQWAADVLEEVKQAEIQRNRHRVIEISHRCECYRKELENVEMSFVKDQSPPRDEEKKRHRSVVRVTHITPIGQPTE
ncbi:hypothetical protein BaRGS_00034148 [Batillaria attramentaria]|uniref:Dynein regulatory complex subunit 3 n=1 Tax=Batillaria attramentaria TaxID=370345 RepID=A0ABD0JI43_9CAEN